MPMYKNPFEKGQLIIQFKVEFPEKMNTDILSSLEKILPSRQAVTSHVDSEYCSLVDFSPSAASSRHHGNQRQVYDDDEDSDDEYGAGGEGPGRSGMQCQPQ